MLDLSKLYQTTITDQDGVERTHPCRIVSFNTVTEKYGISVAGIGNVLFVNAGDLETTDQSTPSGSITINDDGSYDVSAYAGVTVNVNNLGSTTVTDDGTVNSTHYSSVVVNVNNEQNPKQITTYANDIDTTHFASVDTTALEPTGTVTISTYANNNNVYGYQYADTTGLEPTGSLDITQNGNNINVKDKATVNVNIPEKFAVCFDAHPNGNFEDTGLSIYVTSGTVPEEPFAYVDPDVGEFVGWNTEEGQTEGNVSFPYTPEEDTILYIAVVPNA